MGKKGGGGRIVALLVVCGVVLAVFLARLADLQFLRADEYAAKAAAASRTVYTVDLPAARGDITDRSGVVLAQDTAVYDLNLCLPAPGGTDLETTLNTLKELGLTDSGGEDVETQLAAFLSAVSAGELPLAAGLDAEQARRVYAAGLAQSGAVRLVARGRRTWAEGNLLPHALGFTGAITAEQWQADDYALCAAGVAMNAEIGQSGLEAAYDELLRGKSGTLTVTAGRDGSVSAAVTRAPQPGATLVLTLDSGLQRTARRALIDQIETLRATRAAGQGKEARAGAAVVVDVKTGGILASVSAPGYDLARYRADYAALAADENAPLLDRVTGGLYPPGSAFKPAVAAAALAAGIVTPQDTVACTGRYNFYGGYRPGCLQIGHGGPVDLVTALKYSCNIYFYDVGRRVGVDGVSAAANRLGLAAPTGVELAEAAGRLTWSTDDNYQSGLALMAAIGQGNTAVTPLQLAAYAAALACDGVRPALHYAERAVGADGETLWQYTPKTQAEAPGGAAVFGPIRAGMEAMASTLAVLRDAPIPLAAKTGSPQRAETLSDGSHYTNSVLVGYAPADDPQIAVAVVLEYGGGGANAAPVLRAIADHWWAENGG